MWKLQKKMNGIGHLHQYFISNHSWRRHLRVWNLTLYQLGLFSIILDLLISLCRYKIWEWWKDLELDKDRIFIKSRKSIMIFVIFLPRDFACWRLFSINIEIELMISLQYITSFALRIELLEIDFLNASWINWVLSLISYSVYIKVITICIQKKVNVILFYSFTIIIISISNIHL